MTAQEIYEREGFLILGSDKPLPLGPKVIENKLTPDHLAMLPRGTMVVVVGEVTTKEEIGYRARTGIQRAHGARYFYKVIAE